MQTDYDRHGVHEIAVRLLCRLYVSTHFLVVNEVAVTHGLERLDGLSSTQAIGIQLGLKRDDVIKLTNFSHMKALAWLASHGLTAEMLLTRNDNGHVFTWHYAWALRNLVEERHFTVVQALKEIDGLNADQVRGINEGLTRDDVINLTNVWHISVLTKLASHGLTAEMLLTHNDNGHEFNEQHARALMNLVKDRNFTVIQALEEIDGLNSDEAIDINEGLTRGDVIHSNSVFRR